MRVWQSPDQPEPMRDGFGRTGHPNGLLIPSNPDQVSNRGGGAARASGCAGGSFAQRLVHGGEGDAIEDQFDLGDHAIVDGEELDAVDGAGIGVGHEVVVHAGAIPVGEDLADVVAFQGRQQAAERGDPRRLVVCRTGERGDEVFGEQFGEGIEIVAPTVSTYVRAMDAVVVGVIGFLSLARTTLEHKQSMSTTNHLCYGREVPTRGALVTVASAAADLDQALRALADVNRREILAVVRSGPQPVGIIAEEVGLSQQATSHHLGVLRTAGLVEGTRVGTRHLFVVHTDGLAAVRAYLDDFWPTKLAALKSAAEAGKGGADG